MTPLKLSIWILLALAQLAVPAWMIVGQERVLRDGRQIKLQTQPVDPADLFRGRYVALGFPVEQVPRELVRGHFDHEDVAYLELRERPDGIAEAVALHKEKPSADLVIEGKVTFISPEIVGVELPFNRYYMDESAAPAAEIAYRNLATDGDSWVTVRLLNGRAVLEELYIGGKPIAEFLRAPTR